MVLQTTVDALDVLIDNTVGEVEGGAEAERSTRATCAAGPMDKWRGRWAMSSEAPLGGPLDCPTTALLSESSAPPAAE